LLNENLPVDVKVGGPPLVDVQQAPRDLASAEGDEREAAMTVDGHGHVLLCSLLHERSRQFIVTSIFFVTRQLHFVGSRRALW
jgi:hypothetical protein